MNVPVNYYLLVFVYCHSRVNIPQNRRFKIPQRWLSPPAGEGSEKRHGMGGDGGTSPARRLDRRNSEQDGSGPEDGEKVHPDHIPAALRARGARQQAGSIQGLHQE